jgi:hypothetical protein
MRRFVLTVALIGLVLFTGRVLAETVPSPYVYKLSFSTFFSSTGGASCVRGITVDAQGNVYVVGPASPWFPTTPGAFHQAGAHPGPFVAKFNPTGGLVWSTVLFENSSGAGEGGGTAFSIIVDKAGYVYVYGHVAPTAIVTPGAFQTTYGGTPTDGPYVAKLKPDGSDLVWGSWVGAGGYARDMDMDEEGNLYLVLAIDAAGIENAQTLPPSWFTNAFKKTHCSPLPTGYAKGDTGIIKVSNDGSNVFWATWVGGSQGNSYKAGVKVGHDKCPVIFVPTLSHDMPTTPGAYSRSWIGSGQFNLWLGKFSADGSSLISGTFVDGGDQYATHNVALDKNGNIFVTHCGPQTSAFPATPGALQTTYGGGLEDFWIGQFSPTGALLAGTYLGGSGDEENSPDQILVDPNGNVFLVGYTSSTNFPVTSGAFQSAPKNPTGGGYTAVLSMFSNDLSNLLYSSYMGGSRDDDLRACAVGPDGTLYVAGGSGSPDWPLTNAYQSVCKIVSSVGIGWGNANCVVAKLTPGQPLPVITAAPTVTPNPVVTGQAVTFAVGATDPSTNVLSYRWAFGDDTSNSVAYGTAPTHAYAAAGTYLATVTVNDGCGGLAIASVSVTNTAVAPTITTQPSNQTVNVGEPATFSVVATGTAPLFYQWQKNGTNITGATSAAATMAAAQLTDAASYTVIVSNSAGSVTSSNATLTVNNVVVPPTITTQPSSQTVNVGEPATFRVVATGTTPMFYQWQKNGTNITGATSATDTISAAQTTDAGSYTVIVSNSVGSVTGSNATLTVNNVADWSGWPYLKAITINHSQVVGTQTNFPVLIAIDDDHDLTAHARADGADLVFTDTNGNLLAYEMEAGYSATGGTTGGTKVRVWVRIPTLSSSTDTVIHLRYGNPSCGTSRQNAAQVWINGYVGVWHLGESASPAYDSTSNTTTLAGNAGSAFGAPGAIDNGVSFDGSTGFLTTTTAAVLGLVGSPGTISAWIYPTVLSAARRICEIGTTGTATGYQFALGAGNTFRYGSSGGVVSSTSTLSSNTWQQMVVAWDGTNVRFYLQGAAAGTSAYAYYPQNNGTTFKIGDAVFVDNAGNRICGTLDEVRISYVSRSAGWIATEYNNQRDPAGFAGSGSEWSLPRIITPPSTQAVNVGQSASFSVAVSGTPPLFYQWQLNDINIVGATNATYIITATQPSDAGTYSVVVSNTAGTLTTAGGQLTVNPFQITSLVIQTNDVLITWTTTGGQTNIVQTTADLIDGFTNLSPNIAIPGMSAVTTNYLDVGAATNGLVRFYRILVVP